MTVDEVIEGGALDVLRGMDGESADLVVTSPPYWGLRDYGTGTWEGGDEWCDHREAAIRMRRNLAEAANASDGGSRSASARADQDLHVCYRDTCAKCGARRTDKQLGLEPTLDEYVANMVAVFREVRRVLKGTGSLYLNLGDGYAGSMKGMSGGVAYGGPKQRTNQGSIGVEPSALCGLKPKDICGVPWRVAFALQSDGWWLREEIIWHKPNPMPESVRDRCTRAHEYLFHLTKAARYYYDADAVAEEAVAGHGSGNGYKRPAQLSRGGRGDDEPYSPQPTRNRRSVWTIATQAFKGAHFATFPPKLVEPCVRAACPPGGLVLDPFMGAGTVGLVAVQEGRHYLGIELNPEYAQMARERIAKEGRRLVTVT